MSGIWDSKPLAGRRRRDVSSISSVACMVQGDSFPLCMVRMGKAGWTGTHRLAISRRCGGPIGQHRPPRTLLSDATSYC